MKKQFLSILTVLAIGFSSCSSDHQHGQSNPTTGEAKAHGTTKEYTAAYVCPMHCQGSGSDQPGTCPACGMDYVSQAEHVKDGHVH